MSNWSTQNRQRQSYASSVLPFISPSSMGALRRCSRVALEHGKLMQVIRSCWKEMSDYSSRTRSLTLLRNGLNRSSEPISPVAETRLIKLSSFPPVRPRPRTASTSTDDVVRYAGPINLTPDDPAPHSMEPQFRKLGMTTSLIRGVPTLGAPHVVCTKGDVLNANQVQLLKLFHKTYATVSFSHSTLSSRR